MRVSILTYAPSGWGGTEVNTLGFARALAADGHSVALVQLGHRVYREHIDANEAVELRDVDPPAPLNAIPFGWWRRLLRSLEPDVCALSKGGFEVRAPALDLAAHVSARRYVLIEHHPAEALPPRTSSRHLGGLVPGIGLWWWREFLPAWFHLRLADRVITDSEHVTSVLESSFRLDRSKTFCVHPGIDAGRVAFRPCSRDRLRTAWGIPDDAVVIGSVARLVPVKALDRAVRAVADLHAQRVHPSLWLVIGGDGPERASLRQLAAELGVADRVVTPGYVPDVADALSAFDVFVMPSREEGFGITLLEAMACERVSVAMNSGGPAEIITNDLLGWLTPADDQEAFVAGVRQAVLLSADERRMMGARARSHVVDDFSRETQMRRLARLIVEA